MATDQAAITQTAVEATKAAVQAMATSEAALKLEASQQVQDLG